MVSTGKACAQERCSCTRQALRYRTNDMFRLKARARAYAKQLKAGVIHSPSAYLLRRYQLETLATELGLKAVERQERVNDATLEQAIASLYQLRSGFTLDRFARTSSPAHPSESGSQGDA